MQLVLALRRARAHDPRLESRRERLLATAFTSVNTDLSISTPRVKLLEDLSTMLWDYVLSLIDVPC